jgi:thiamine pyrophosphokinase
MEIEKKDWEDLKRSIEQMLKNSMISTMQYETALALCVDKIASFKDEAEIEINGIIGNKGDSEVNTE